MTLYSKETRAFSGSDLEIAGEVADQIAIAIRQALLFEQVQAAKLGLESLSRRLIESEETERRRISRELHDQTGQSLTAIKMNLERALRDSGSVQIARRLNESLGMIEQTITEIRDLARDLRPSLLDDLGLVPALRSYCNLMADRLGISVEFVAEVATDRLDPKVETTCYRVAQEALTNVAKHARATHVRVELCLRGTDLNLLIVDDGSGFNVTQALTQAAAGASIGVLGMRERAALIGGKVSITSGSGLGTEVRAVIPCINC